MISHKNKFLFIHIHKTGGNSVQNILKDYSEEEIVVLGGDQDGVERFDIRNPDASKIKKHAIMREYREVYGDKLDSYFKFSTIRNPFDRLVSWYFSPHRKRVEFDFEDFKNFVERDPLIIHTRFQFYIAHSEAHASALYRASGASEIHDHGLDYIMRFENLNEDFQAVCHKLNIPPAELPVRNKGTSRLPYRECYDLRLRRFVEEKHSYELALGNYKF